LAPKGPRRNVGDLPFLVRQPCTINLLHVASLRQALSVSITHPSLPRLRFTWLFIPTTWRFCLQRSLACTGGSACQRSLPCLYHLLSSPYSADTCGPRTRRRRWARRALTSGRTTWTYAAHWAYGRVCDVPARVCTRRMNDARGRCVISCAVTSPIVMAVALSVRSTHLCAARLPLPLYHHLPPRCAVRAAATLLRNVTTSPTADGCRRRRTSAFISC